MTPVKRYPTQHLVTWFVAAAVAVVFPSPVSAQATAFLDVNVVPMTGSNPLPAQTVLVRDGVIAALGPTEEVRIPDDARRVDGRGRWLAPGLVDAHVHLFSRSDLDLYLANGVTTIVNLGGYGAADSVLALRQAVSSGRLRGPTIYTSGNWLDGDPPIRSINTVVRDAAAARAEVRRQHEAGYDFVKVYSALSPAVFAALVDEAARVRMPVTGHVPVAVGVDAVLASGQANVAHAGAILFNALGFEATETRLERLARRVQNAGVSVTTTLWMAELAFRQQNGPDAIAEVMARDEMKYLPPARRRAWRENNMFANYPRIPVTEGKRRLSLLRSFVSALVEAQVSVLAGTDSDVAGSVPGFSMHEELRSLAFAGLEPHEVLRTATADPGAWLASSVNLDVPFGTVEPGARADLLLLDANPLEDLATLRRPVGVMVRGAWLARSELERLLAQADADTAFDGVAPTAVGERRKCPRSTC